MTYEKPAISASYFVSEMFGSAQGFLSATNVCDFGPGKDTGHNNDNSSGPCGPH